MKDNTVMSKESIGIGLMGLGVIGGQVARVLLGRPGLISVPEH